MIEAGQAPLYSKVAILGLTFKENCPDIRNSKVVDIIKELNSFGIKPLVVDPWADANEAEKEYGLKMSKIDDISDSDCIVVAVAHNEFKNLNIDDIKKCFKYTEPDKNVLIDIKGIYSIDSLKNSGLKWWRL
jgi:UDP-N-acetyl-D-galactosamine dehydrogenase